MPERALRRLLAALVLAVVAVAVPLAAQEAGGDAAAQPDWQPGPTEGDLGNAAIAVPEGYLFLDDDETRRILERMGNLTNGSERGAVFPAADDEDWFVVFEFDEVGYVKDDEKDELDHDALLAEMREGSVASNERRREAGLPELRLVGWEQPPSYDPETNNLQWCLRYDSTDGPVLNCNIRMLGRRGVMSATLVADPEDLAAAMPRTRELLRGYDFRSGERYAEFSRGDKVAEYGLKGLLLGGAAAAAVKTGLFKKLGKFIVLIVAGAAALVKRLVTRLRKPTLPPIPAG